MKAHIGVDAESGAVHTVVATGANEAGVTQAHRLLHGDESDAYGDAGYQGVEKRPENRDAEVNWHTAMKPSKRRALPDTPAGRRRHEQENVKASIRAIVEHPFHILKNRLGYRKVRYKGLAKNEAHLFTLFGLANLLRLKKPLLALQGGSAS